MIEPSRVPSFTIVLATLILICAGSAVAQDAADEIPEHPVSNR